MEYPLSLSEIELDVADLASGEMVAPDETPKQPTPGWTVEGEQEPDPESSTERDTQTERLFTAEIARLPLLDRCTEEQLAREIMRRRKRIRRLLRSARKLCEKALSDAGRGVVLPEKDFRERETIAILRYAREALRSRHSKRLTGMSRKELHNFADELSSALREYRKLRDRMVKANLRLVLLFARQHRHASLSFTDFIQEGILGLIRAVEKYEAGRNVKFSTYAAYWIWQQIARAADLHGSLIRTPVHWNQLRRRLYRDLCQPPGEGKQTTTQWAEERSLDPEKVSTMTQPFRFISMDGPVSEEDDRPLEELLTTETVEPEEEAMRATLRTRLECAVRQLPPREAEIMRRRFGLRDDHTDTLEDIATDFGVSRERIRQLEARALRRLKPLCEAEGLAEFLH